MVYQGVLFQVLLDDLRLGDRLQGIVLLRLSTLNKKNMAKLTFTKLLDEDEVRKGHVSDLVSEIGVMVHQLFLGSGYSHLVAARFVPFEHNFESAVKQLV